MGNSTNQKDWNIKFIQNLDDINFGNIDIYKNEQGKYIMMLRRTFMKDDKNKYSKQYGFHQILKSIQEQQNTKQFLTPILHSSQKIQNLCIVYQVIDTYCEYFNFTLADMIKHKKQMDVDQLWMCFYWLIRYSRLLKQKQWVMEQGINMKKIFITLKGMPTVSIHHLMKSITNDTVYENMEQKTLGEQVGFIMLQLACMNFINENQNIELYLRKVQKIDKNLGQLLGNILRKTINTRQKNKLSQKDIQDKIQKLLLEGEIQISKQIKINKFKYVITKPQNSTSTFSQDEPKNIGNKENQQKNKNLNITINNLQGRKNTQSNSLRGSNKRTNFDFLENNIQLFSGAASRNSSKAPTPMNKTLSVKNALLMDQIENRKKQTQKQMQKLNERKEQIMKNINKNNVNKQNYLGNSIRQVRPSYNKKQSWSRKILNQHLKQSNKK